jgi:hypothetical protein
MKNLGSMNSWYANDHYPNGWNNPPIKGKENIPAEYVQCRKEGHPLKEVVLGRCLVKHFCEICQISWEIDSSD